MLTHKNYTILALLWATIFMTSSCRSQTDIREELSYQAEQSKAYISAHRGGRNLASYPENALETFDYTLSNVPNSILEFDVNMSSDSVLLLMHDNSLDRTTSGSGLVKERTFDYIKSLYLIDDFGKKTNFRPPSFEDVLVWTKKKQVFLTIDIKRGVPFEKVVAALRKHKMQRKAAIITYSIRDAIRVHELAPDYMLSISIRNQEEWRQVQASAIPMNRIIAFTGTRLSDESLYQELHENGIMCILGTLGNLDKSAQARGDELYCKFLDLGVDILATDRPKSAALAINSCEKH